MKKFLTILSLIIAGTLAVFADGRQEALSFFNSYVNAANTYSNSVGDMYSPNAKIIRQVIKPDGTTADAVTNTATYLKQMKLGQAGARIKGYKNNYTNISVTEMPNGAYKISSLRQPSGESYKLKTYMIVKKQPNGKWLITEEMMQTKVQMFLKYVN
ncbi:MAG: hypothetical protein Q4E83_06195 [bacterium]|nr:hypothetical protein [bacterium]